MRRLLRKKIPFGEICISFSADEVYAIGLLHDIGHVLLANVAPDIYGRPWTSGEEYDSLCCVSAADSLVTERFPLPIEEWSVSSCCQPEIADTVALSEEEFHLLKNATEAHCMRWLCE